MPVRPPLQRLFARLVSNRIPVLVVYALLLPLAIVLALRIPSVAAIDDLLVASDPDVVATHQFEKVFPDLPTVVLLLEADDPWQVQVLADQSRLQAALRAVPHVTVVSALDVFRRVHPEADVTQTAGAEEFRRFAGNARFFRRQALVGDAFQGLVLVLDAKDDVTRDAALAGIDRAISATPAASLRGIRRVGAPYVEAWIEHESGAATLRFFPVFGLFVIGIALYLYRSLRSLLAIVLALGTSVALAMGAGQLLGFSFTVVSALVPLTVLVTTLATLVYVHSRFVDQPPGVDVDEHQLFALQNKFLPVTVSSAAAVAGFAALAVSNIRPIRDMGLWTAAGLAIAWVVSFTLFPALQRVLRTPTVRVVPLRTAFYDRISAALPGVTRRWRVVFLAVALLLAGGGVVSLVGVPGHVAPMSLNVDVLDYVDHSLPIHRDMVYFRAHVSGLEVARVWVRTPAGRVVEPEVLRGLERFTTSVESLPRVSSVVGPTTFLRLRRYAAGQGEELPQDPQAFAGAIADIEQLLLSEPELRGFIDVGTLASAQVTVTFHDRQEGYAEMAANLRAAWERTVGSDPAFAGITMQVVGESLIQAKVGSSLVPTFTESFALTAALIFAAFLFVFRSASARLMAMIPSLVAILVTFLGMRLFGASLNLATILIATTVLGTTENDQIHFFHHLQEGSGPGGFEAALRHTLRVSGRAIVFATLINAAGFLGLAFSSFPPLRQFGVIASAAFLLAMLADFTALPAALWFGRRARSSAAPSPPPQP